MMSHEERIHAYEVDTNFLEISGMEYLEMLFNRSEIAKIENALSASQKARLAQADQRLVRDAHRFYAAIQSIAHLKSWRDQENVPPDHWWWYLDVLASAPVAAAELTKV
jgi:hypothetical protein